MSALGDAISRFRQSEYTGTNRCAPCTVLNVLIAAVIAGLLIIASLPWLGILAFAVFAGIIYLRGYLVPGTPTLTKRYFPAWLLALFSKESSIDPLDVTASTETDDEPLVTAGVVTWEGTDSVDLTSSFRDEWTAQIHAVRERGVEPTDVRAMFDAETISQHGEHSFVVDRNKSVRWDSNAALVGDVAATEILRERLNEWTDFDRDHRRTVLTGLRLCRERCPSCDGPLSVSEERVDPCCQKPHLVAQSVCRDCGAVLADDAVVDNGETATVRARLLKS